MYVHFCLPSFNGFTELITFKYVFTFSITARRELELLFSEVWNIKQLSL